jgi:hypothetical protein
MATLSDRRNGIRANVRIPLRFRLLGNQSVEEQLGESGNLSQRGVFMWTAYPLQLGTQVELRLRMPSEISGTLASEVHCTARVIRIGEIDSGGPVVVGLRIERYHTSAERERRAS